MEDRLGISREKGGAILKPYHEVVLDKMEKHREGNRRGKRVSAHLPALVHRQQGLSLLEPQAQHTIMRGAQQKVGIVAPQPCGSCRMSG